MSQCKVLRKYIKSDVPKDNPEVEYLLGFEIEEEKRLPVKTYIRRLWLPFQSSRSSMPRCFLDDPARDFSKEIDHWGSDFVNDPDLLAKEVGKDRIVVDPFTTPIQTRTAFLEETAYTLLVTRHWGDQLWGHRKYCVGPLVNEKREPGDNKPPKWPEDHELISMAVRQWIAARLQERLKNPREKKRIPRVECPENPAERRELIAAKFGEIERFDSEEEVDQVEQVASEEREGNAEQPPRPQTPEDQRMRRLSTGQPRASRPVIGNQELFSTRDIPHDRADPPADRRRKTRKRVSRYSKLLPDLRAGSPQTSSLDLWIERNYPKTHEPFIPSSSALKRTRNEQDLPRKRSKNAPDYEESTGPLPTPETSICIAQSLLEDDRVLSSAPSLAPSLDPVDVEGQGDNYNVVPISKSSFPQHKDVSTDKLQRSSHLYDDQNSAASRSLHQEKPTESGANVIMLASPKESSPLESTEALETVSTMQNSQAKEGKLDHTSRTAADLDINFDQHGDPSADSHLNVSQDHISVEVTSDTQHSPPEPQQHCIVADEKSLDEVVANESQDDLPLPTQKASSHGQLSTKEVATALYHKHQTIKHQTYVPLWWEEPDLDVLQRMVNSLQSVLNGSLTYNYMLNRAIPSVRERFEKAAADVEEPNEIISAWPIRLLTMYAEDFARLPTENPFSQILGCNDPCATPIKDHSSEALFLKLERLNQWFMTKIPTWNEGRHHVNLAASHDLKILVEETLPQEPDYRPNKSVWITLLAYDMLVHHLRKAYAEGFGGTPLANDLDKATYM